MTTFHMDTKSLFAPKQGKLATKGQKQIYEDNRTTIKFYMQMAFIATLFNASITFYFNKFNIFWLIFALFNYIGSIFAMKYMARPVFVGGNTAKHIVDGGIDLNLKSGFGDHLKDLVIATAICQFLSSYSTLFWILWFFIPFYFFYLIWVNFIWPWFHQPADDEKPEVSDKKKRKMERKVARGYK